MHSTHNANASANTITKHPGSASLASALAVAASTAAARKGAANSSSASTPTSSKTVSSGRTSASPGRGLSAAARQQQHPQQHPPSGISSAAEAHLGAAGSPAPFLPSAGPALFHAHLQPHGLAAKYGGVRTTHSSAGGAGTLGDGPGQPHTPHSLPPSIADLLVLEGMQHDLRRLQLVLDFGPEAGIALGPLPDPITPTSSIEIDSGANHAVTSKPPKPGSAAANSRGKAKNATKDKGGDAGVPLAAADSGGLSLSSRPESACSGDMQSSNSSGASKKELDKLGAEIEAIMAQATEAALAKSNHHGSQPPASSPDQNAAIRAALLQLFCCRTGHLLSVLCTTLGGYAGTFNDTSWARDTAASCSHATKDASSHCVAGASNCQHSISQANGHGTGHGVNNSQHNNHLPHVMQPEHPNSGSGQQAWYTLLRGGRPNSALPPKAGGVANGKLRANSAHPGAHSGPGAATHSTGTSGVTSGLGQTQGMGAGGSLANGVKGLGHKAAHHRSLGHVSMYPMLQAISDVTGCLGQFKSIRKERDEMMLEIQNLRRQQLSLHQDNTLLRNYIADSNLDSPKVQPRCSVCAKSLNSSQPPPPPGPDGTLLLTLNMQLQQQLQQAQLQLQQQQKKAKEQLEQHHLLAQTELRSSVQRLSVAEDMLEAAQKDIEAQKKKAEASHQQAEELQAQITPHQEQLWSVQRIERQQAAEVRQKLEAELKEAIAHKVRAEAEMRVAKMEVFELKSAESVRSNTAHREDSAKDELAAENKALTAEVSKLRSQHSTLQHAVKAAEQRAEKAAAATKTAEQRADKATEATKAAEQRAEKAAAATKAEQQRADKATAAVKAAEQRAERAAAEASKAAAKGDAEASTEKLSKALAEAKANEQKAAAALKAAEQRASQAEAAAKVADFRATKGVKAVEALEQENRKLEAALSAAQQKAEGTTSQAEDERKRLAAAEKQVASLTSQLLQAQSRLEASMHATAEAEARCSEASSSKATKSKIAGLESQLKEAKEQASKASKAKIAGLEVQLAETKDAGRGEAEEAKKALAEAKEQLGSKVSMVTRLKAEVNQLREQLKGSQENKAQVSEVSSLEAKLKEVQERAAKAEAGQARTAKAEAALERREADAERVQKELYKVKAESESKEEQLAQEKEQLESLRAALEAEIASVRAMGTLSQAKTMRFDINTLNNAAATAASSRPSTARSSDSSGGGGPSALLPPSIPGTSTRPVSGHDQASHARLGHMVRELQSQLSAERARAAQAASEAEALQRQLEKAAVSQGPPTADAKRHALTTVGSKEDGQGQQQQQQQQQQQKELEQQRQLVAQQQQMLEHQKQQVDRQQQQQQQQQQQAGWQEDQKSQWQRAERQQQQLQAQRKELQRVKQEAEVSAGRAASEQKQLQEELTRSLGEKQQAEAAREEMASKLEGYEHQVTHLTGKLKAAEAQVAAHKGYAESAGAELRAFLAAYQADSAGDKRLQSPDSVEPADRSFLRTASAAAFSPTWGRNPSLRNFASNSMRNRPFSAQPAPSPRERPPALNTLISAPVTMTAPTLPSAQHNHNQRVASAPVGPTQLQSASATQHDQHVPVTPAAAWAHTATPVEQHTPGPQSNNNRTPGPSPSPRPQSAQDRVPESATSAAAAGAHSPLGSHRMAVRMESRPSLHRTSLGTPFVWDQQQQQQGAEGPEGEGGNEEDSHEHMPNFSTAEDEPGAHVQGVLGGHPQGTQSKLRQALQSEQPHRYGGEVKAVSNTRGGGVYGSLSRGLAVVNDSSGSNSSSTGTATGGISGSNGLPQQQQQQQQRQQGWGSVSNGFPQQLQQQTLMRPRPSSALHSSFSNSSMKSNSSSSAMVTSEGQPGAAAAGPLSRPSSARAFQSRVSFHASTRERPQSSLLAAGGSHSTRPFASITTPAVSPQLNEGRAQPPHTLTAPNTPAASHAQSPHTLSAPNTPAASTLPFQAPSPSIGAPSDSPMSEGPISAAPTPSQPSSTTPGPTTAPPPLRVTPAPAPAAAAGAPRAASRLASDEAASLPSRVSRPRPLTIERSFGSVSGGGSLPGSPATPAAPAAPSSRVLSPQLSRSRSFIREPSPGSPPQVILPTRPGSARITTIGYRIPPSPSRRLRSSSNSGLSSAAASKAASKHTSRSVSRSSLAPSHPQNSNSAATEIDDDAQQDRDNAHIEEAMQRAHAHALWVQQAWDEGFLPSRSSTGREGAAAEHAETDVAPLWGGPPSETCARFQPHPPSLASGAGEQARYPNPRSYHPKRPVQADFATTAEHDMPSSS